MGTVSNPAAGDILDQLVALSNKNEMITKIHFNRKGAFQSRSVTVGANTSQVNEIIKELGIRIKAVDGVNYRDEAEKLQMVLKSFVSAETDNRSKLAKIQHTFSRNRTLLSLEKEIEKTLTASSVIEKLMEFDTEDAMKKILNIGRQGNQPRYIAIDGKTSYIKDVVQKIKAK